MRNSYLTAIIGTILGMACLVVAVSPSSLCQAERGRSPRNQAFVKDPHSGLPSTGPGGTNPQSVLWGNGPGKAKRSLPAENSAAYEQAYMK
jgi:hypothetical protein